MQNDPRSAGEHTLVLAGRHTATLTGVEDVECFNEQIVVLRTPLGALTLSGEALNISHLNLSEGKLVVEGDIASAEYTQSRQAARKGFFGRLFS